MATSHRADALLRRVPARAWQQVSAGKGAKGHRLYDWAFVRLDHDGPAPGDQAGQHWLWSAATSGPASWPSTAATRPARCRWPCWSGSPGRRWTVEERFQTGKGLVGLDQHQVRRWRSWYRWATLAMLAHAFLVVAALTEHTRHPPPQG